MSNNSSSSSGTSILGLLGIAFVILKLTGFINWSWWYVTLPLWGGLVLLIAGLLIYLIILVIGSTIKKKKYKQRMKEIHNDEPNEVLTFREGSFQERLHKKMEDHNTSN